MEVDDTYQSAFAKSDNVSRQISGDYDKIQNFTGNKGATIGIVTLIPDILNLLKNTIVLPFSLVGGMVASVVDYLHLPEWVETLMLTGFTIMALFAFAALVLRYKYV